MKHLEDLAAALGDDDQRTRFAAGELPEEDLLALARTELFRPLASVARWAGRDWTKIEQNIAHSGRCWMSMPSGLLYLHEIVPLEGYTIRQWDTLAKIHRAAEEIRRHPWIEMALGRSPDLAVNHDPEALEIHRRDHPQTRHYIEDIRDVAPVGIAWFSPDCKYHSNAKGDPPIAEEIRDDSSVVVVDSTYRAICRQCQGEARRHVSKVSIAWAGRTLVREYVL